jgi:DNA-binding MarR family transcriptional regulator
VIICISERGIARIGEIADDLGLERSTISRHVAKLVDRGLVQRVDPGDDRRSAPVQLTRAGKQTRSKLAVAWAQVVSDAVASWPGSDVDAFSAMIRTFAEGLEGLADVPARGRAAESRD